MSHTGYPNAGWGAPQQGYPPQPGEYPPAYGAPPSYSQPSASYPSYGAPAPAAPYAQAPPPGYAQQPPPGYAQQPPPGYAQAPPSGYAQQQPPYGYTPPPMGMPAAPHQPAVSTATSVIVAGAAYCYPHPVQLVVKERTMGVSGDDFEVFDASGRLMFRMDARAFSIKEKRTLADASGQPALSMSQKPLSLRGTWEIYRGASTSVPGAKVAEVRTKTLSLTPELLVFLNDGDKEADFKVKGNFLAKKYEVVQVLPGGGKRSIAAIDKVSRFSSGAAFMRAALTDKQSYAVTVQPGVDVAFVVALAVLCDEFHHDNKEHD